MKELKFEKPRTSIEEVSNQGSYGKFVISPLERGFGITLGNALRRTLLSSLPGCAIVNMKIDGAEHEFQNVDGVVEDVITIILNLKRVVLSVDSEDPNFETIVEINKGEGEVTAADIIHSNEVVVVNPEQHIATVSAGGNLHMFLTVRRGVGYVSSAANKEYNQSVGVISIDSIYTPIVNVKYASENFRVEQKTDYEKLTIEIDTDGSIHPKDALKEAAKILIHHFMLFSDEKITIDLDNLDGEEDFDEDALHMRQLLKTKLVDLDLSVRALNCLKSAEVETLAELVSFNRNDLLKFRNFGKKSLVELDEKLESLNLSFGMDISKYKLDKE